MILRGGIECVFLKNLSINEFDSTVEFQKSGNRCGNISDSKQEFQLSIESSFSSKKTRLPQSRH